MKLFHKLYRIPHYLKATLHLKSEDVLLASYPKSGNTWIRNIICNYISIQELGGKIIDFKSLDEIMPGFGTNVLFNAWEYKIPRFIATHFRYGNYFLKPRKVLIRRDPRDVMVSFYYYSNSKKTLPNYTTLSELLADKKYGLDKWIKYYKSWFKRADYIITYENMLQDDYLEIEKMFQFLQVDIDSKNLKLAVERSRFKNFSKIEEKFGHSKKHENLDDFKFVRKGIVGDYVNHFTEEDLLNYSAKMSKNGLNIYT